MSYDKATAFVRKGFEVAGRIKSGAVVGVAFTGQTAGDQLAVIGPDTTTALRGARRLHGWQLQADGAQDVVILRADDFDKLLLAAGATVTTFPGSAT